jgi:ABC-type glycerol-3-phosphate transport system substrate-binding protein
MSRKTTRISNRDLRRLAAPGGARGFGRRTVLASGLALAAPSIVFAQGKRTVTIWCHFAGTNYEILKRFIAKFNDANPDIEIKTTSIGASEILPKYLAAVAAGAPPDIFHAPGYVPPDLARDKVIVPLDSMVKLPPTILKNFEPITVYDGQRFGVPVNGGLGAMCYNLDLFEKAGLDPAKLPQTWDELLSASLKITSANDNRWGLELGNQPGLGTTQVFWTFLQTAGGDLVAPDGKTSAFDSGPGLETLTFLADAVKTHKISPRKAYTDIQSWSEWGTRKIGSVLLYPVFTANILATKVRSATAPAPMKVKHGAHFAGNYWTISSASKNKEAAARFCQWWVQPSISGPWAGESGAIPNSQAAIEDPGFKEFLAKNPLGQAFLDSIPGARPFPGVLGLPAIVQIVSEMVQSAVLGDTAPKEALAKAAQRADQELKRAQKT